MVEEQLLRRTYDRNSFNQIVDAFKILQSYRVFEIQAEEIKANFVRNFDSKSVEELAADIVKAQEMNRSLATLHQLGDMVKKGNDDA